jgi:hypothetical protein
MTCPFPQSREALFNFTTVVWIKSCQDTLVKVTERFGNTLNHGSGLLHGRHVVVVVVICRGLSCEMVSHPDMKRWLKGAICTSPEPAAKRRRIIRVDKDMALKHKAVAGIARRLSSLPHAVDLSARALRGTSRTRILSIWQPTMTPGNVLRSTACMCSAGPCVPERPQSVTASERLTLICGAGMYHVLAVISVSGPCLTASSFVARLERLMFFRGDVVV